MSHTNTRSHVTLLHTHTHTHTHTHSDPKLMMGSVSLGYKSHAPHKVSVEYVNVCIVYVNQNDYIDFRFKFHSLFLSLSLSLTHTPGK